MTCEAATYTCKCYVNKVLYKVLWSTYLFAYDPDCHHTVVWISRRFSGRHLEIPASRYM